MLCRKGEGILDSEKQWRMVVKIGSSSLTDSMGGLSPRKLREHVEALAYLHELGHEIILVSSGAVAAGFRKLGFTKRPKETAHKQASAAVGQGLLMHSYLSEFTPLGITIAQILLTRGNFASRHQFLNAHNALLALISRRVIPIINENDTVAIEELTFGDNDMLSALVAGALHADMLTILTDTDGVYDSDPRRNPNAIRIPLIDVVTPEVESLAKGSSSQVGTGGMRTKLAAAKVALLFGVRVFIGRGQGPEKLHSIGLGNGNGTYFGSSPLLGMRNKQQWIAFHADVAGTIVIDAGASSALLERGKSLLPSGILEVRGVFKQGDVVEVVDLSGRHVGKGVVNYSSPLLHQVKGLPSELAQSLVEGAKPEVIHRDEWVSFGVEVLTCMS